MEPLKKLDQICMCMDTDLQLINSANLAHKVNNVRQYIIHMRKIVNDLEKEERKAA